MQPTAENRVLAEIRNLLRSEENSIVEFKSGNDNPQTIGKLISALSNSARIEEVATAHVVWGVEDGT